METAKRINPNIKLYSTHRDMAMKTAEALDISMSVLTESIFKQVFEIPSAIVYDGKNVHDTFKSVIFEEFNGFKNKVKKALSIHLTEIGYKKLAGQYIDEVREEIEDNNEELFEDCTTKGEISEVIFNLHEEILSDKFNQIIFDTLDRIMKEESPEYFSSWKIFEHVFPKEFKRFILELEMEQRAAHAGIIKQLDANMIIFISKLIFDKGVILLMNDYESVSAINQTLQDYSIENPNVNPYFILHKILYNWEVTNGFEIQLDDHQKVKEFVENYLRESEHRHLYIKVGEIISKIKGLNIQNDQ